MHDYFDILGLPTNAAASEIRRACARHVRRIHPDFCERAGQAPGALVLIHAAADESARIDAAIDFVSMAAIAGRMQTAFFSNGG